MICLWFSRKWTIGNICRQVTQNLCLWDSRAWDLHWTKTDWSLRGALASSEKSHKYNLSSIWQGFNTTSWYKIRAYNHCVKMGNDSDMRVLTDSDIRKLIRSRFFKTRGVIEKESWDSFNIQLNSQVFGEY